MSTSGNALIDSATSKLLSSQLDVGSPASGVLPVANGGTGANNSTTARSNLGLGTISTQNSNTVSITGGTITGITDLAIADGGTGSSTASGARTNLGLGTIATQDSSNVSITGGSIVGITDLAIADGGTGASTAATARTNLGLGTISTQDANNINITGGSITGITDLAIADGGTGASTASGARTNLGLGTIATQDANNVSITGGSITGITDLAVADGGTGASTAENARLNLGSVGILSTTTGINGLSVAATTLYTVPSSRSAIILAASIRLTTTAGLTGTCNAGIGTNGTQDDIFMNTNMLAFNTTGETYVFSSQGNRVLVPAGTSISFGIDNAFGGTTATLAVDLIGFLI